MSVQQVIRNTVVEFCREFVQDPYLCYTEHGQHALLLHMIHTALSEKDRYTYWPIGQDTQDECDKQVERICRVQKEYPTATDLGKSKRQHWDVAVIAAPPKSVRSDSPSVDYFELDAVIEMGMNEDEKHLRDDIQRLLKSSESVTHGYVLHLYRLSDPLFSRRDWSIRSGRVLQPDDVKRIALEELAVAEAETIIALEIFYAHHDQSANKEWAGWSMLPGSDPVSLHVLDPESPASN